MPIKTNQMEHRRSYNTKSFVGAQSNQDGTHLAVSRFPIFEHTNPLKVCKISLNSWSDILLPSFFSSSCVICNNKTIKTTRLKHVRKLYFQDLQFHFKLGIKPAGALAARRWTRLNFHADQYSPGQAKYQQWQQLQTMQQASLNIRLGSPCKLFDRDRLNYVSALKT